GHAGQAHHLVDPGRLHPDARGRLGGAVGRGGRRPAVLRHAERRGDPRGCAPGLSRARSGGRSGRREGRGRTRGPPLIERRAPLGDVPHRARLPPSGRAAGTSSSGDRIPVSTSTPSRLVEGSSTPPPDRYNSRQCSQTTRTTGVWRSPHHERELQRGHAPSPRGTSLHPRGPRERKTAEPAPISAPAAPPTHRPVEGRSPPGPADGPTAGGRRRRPGSPGPAPPRGGRRAPPAPVPAAAGKPRRAARLRLGAVLLAGGVHRARQGPGPGNPGQRPRGDSDDATRQGPGGPIGYGTVPVTDPTGAETSVDGDTVSFTSTGGHPVPGRGAGTRGAAPPIAAGRPFDRARSGAPGQARRFCRFSSSAARNCSVVSHSWSPPTSSARSLVI